MKLIKIYQDKNHKIFNILGLKLKIKTKSNLNSALAYQNQLMFSMITTIKACTIHPEVFGKYKACNKGKTVVLICGGPSIKYFEPIENAVYATVNNCCKYNKVNFDYLFLQELHSNPQKNIIANEYNYKNCKKFYGIIPQNRLSKIYPEIKQIPQEDFDQPNIEKYYLDDRYNYQFAYDLATEPFGDFGGTAFSAMQFLLWTQPDRIYLAGADCSSAGNVFGKSKNSIDLSIHIEKWIKLKQFQQDVYPNIEIISINPVGLKGIFKDIYTNSYIEKEKAV